MFLNQKGLSVEAITTTPLKLRCRAPTVVHDSRLQHLTPSSDSTEIQTKCDWLGKVSSLPDETGHTCLEARWSFRFQGDAVLNEGDTWRNPATTKGNEWMTHDHSPFVSVGGYFQSPPTGVLSSATSKPHDSTTFPLFCTSETVVPRTKELCIKSMTSVTTSNECENPHDSKKNHRHLQGLNRLWDHEKIPEVLPIFRTRNSIWKKNRNFT